MSLIVKRILIGVIIVVGFISTIIGYRIFQTVRTEKNSGDILKAIIKIELKKEDVVQLNNSSYLTRSDRKYIKSFMKKNGWELEEQLGAGYSFKNSKGGRMLLISRYVFGKRYSIFEQNIVN